MDFWEAKAALPVLRSLCLPRVFSKLKNCQTFFISVKFFLENKVKVFNSAYRLKRSFFVNTLL